MKSSITVFLLLVLILSCEKAQIYPSAETPAWLSERISKDEQTIKKDPYSGLDIAAWVRYTYKGLYYFEYVNLLSSAGPRVYNYDGTEYQYNQDGFFRYQSQKCCRLIVWKGPSFIDLWD